MTHTRVVHRTLLLVMCVVFFGSVTRTTPRASAQGDDAAGSPQLTLLDQTHVIGELGSFNLRAQLIGTTPDRASHETAAAVYQRLTSRAELFDAIRLGRLGSPVAVMTAALPAPDSPIVVAAQLGECDGCIPVTADGVYPVTLDVRRRGDFTVISRVTTFIVVARQQSGEQLRVATLVPIELASTLEPDGTHRPMPLTNLVVASEALVNHPAVPLSVTLTPSIVDHAQSDAAVAGTLATLERGLDGRELLASPYELPDPVVISDGRLAEIMKGSWRRGTDVLIERFGVGRVTDGTWLAFNESSFPGRDGLGILEPQTLIVRSDLVSDAAPFPSTDPIVEDIVAIPTAPVVFDTGVVVRATPEGLQSEESLEESTAITTGIVDATLQEHLRADDPVVGASRLFADLALISPERRNGGALVAVPPEVVGRRNLLDRILRVFPTLPFVAPVRVSEVLQLPVAENDDGVVAVARRIGGDTSPDEQLSDAAISSIDAVRRSIEGLSFTVLDSPTAVTADRMFYAGLSRRAEPIRSASLISNPHLAAARRIAESGVSGIQLSPGRPVRLTALRGRIPLTIENPTGRPVTVRLLVARGRVLVPNEFAEQTVTIDQSSIVVPIEVETRSSGRFDVRVSLTTPNGVLLSRQSYSIQSVGVSGLGVTLTVALLMLLFVWWLHAQVQRKRHRQRAADADSPDITDLDITDPDIARPTLAGDSV
jgi:hypothetical protein